jgi:hypothetical protein
MVGDQYPGLTGSFCLREEFCEAIEKIVAVPVGSQDPPPLYPTDHDVMQNTGSVERSLSWHKLTYTFIA